MIGSAGDVLQRFWLAMAGHLWQTSIVLALVALILLAMRRAPARIVCLTAWLGVVKLLLPLHLLGPLTRGLFARFAGGEATVAVEVLSGNAVAAWLYPPLLRSGGHADTSAPWLWIGLTVLWLAGMATLVRRLVLRERRNRLSPSLPATSLPGWVGQRLVEALRAEAIPAGAARLVNDHVVPSVRGLLRPSIVVPAALVARLDTRDLAAILAHENEHRRRRDPLWTAVLATVSVVFFFFPPIWWLRRRVYETTEMACDEAVVAAGHSSRSYSFALARTLDLALTPTGAAPAVHGSGRSLLRRRFERLNLLHELSTRSGTRRLPTMPRHRWTLAAAGLVVLFGSIVPFVPTPATLAADQTPVRSELDGLNGADVPILLSFKEAPLSKIFEAFGAVGPFEVQLDASVALRKATVELKDMTLKQALIELGSGFGLTYSVPEPGRLVVTAQIRLAGVGDVTNPRLIPESKVEPAYPEDMRVAGVEGSVILQAVIDEWGDVTDVVVLRTSRSDYPSLAESAKEAVRQWRYEPATLAGKPVAVYFTIFVEYKLGDGKREDDAEPAVAI